MATLVVLVFCVFGISMELGLGVVDRIRAGEVCVGSGKGGLLGERVLGSQSAHPHFQGGLGSESSWGLRLCSIWVAALLVVGWFVSSIVSKHGNTTASTSSQTTALADSPRAPTTSAASSPVKRQPRVKVEPEEPEAVTEVGEDPEAEHFFYRVRKRRVKQED